MVKGKVIKRVLEFEIGGSITNKNILLKKIKGILTIFSCVGGSRSSMSRLLLIFSIKTFLLQKS